MLLLVCLMDPPLSSILAASIRQLANGTWLENAQYKLGFTQDRRPTPFGGNQINSVLYSLAAGDEQIAAGSVSTESWSILDVFRSSRGSRPQSTDAQSGH